MPDGILPFLFSDFSAFAPLGRVAYLPLVTLLSGWHPSQPLAEAAGELLKVALSRAKADGLPTGTRLEDLQDRAKVLFETTDQKSVNLEDLMEPTEREQLPRPQKGARYYSGRLVQPDTPIGQPDPRWAAEHILAWELELARHFGTTMLVGGRWASLVPPPAFEFRIRLPLARSVRPRDLARAIADDPVAFQDFRKALRTAFAQALQAQGAEDFARQIKRIQHEVIDEGVERLRHQWNVLTKLRVTRLLECGTATIVVAAGMYFAGSLAQIGALFSGAALSFWRELRQRITEDQGLRAQPMYFIWRLLPMKRK